MRLALAAALLAVLSAPAAAQSLSAEKTAEIQAILDTALDQHRVFLNCSITMKPSYDVIRTAWLKDAAQTIVALSQSGFDPVALAKFTQDARIEALLMRKSPFAEVIDYCEENAGWDRQIYEFDYVLLTIAVPKALAN